MIRVAVTGTLGAGKSSVGRLFEEWGALRVDADELARRAVAPGTPGLEEIRREWGEEVLGEDGALDREAMRRLVFRDSSARERLERIVHPEVARLLEERFREAEREGAEVAVAEIPLLFEEGLEEEFELVVAVDAPRDERRRRIIRERDLEPETFDAMEAAQWPGGRKRRAADYVIVNDGGEEELEEEARRVWEAIASRAAAGRPGRSG